MEKVRSLRRRVALLLPSWRQGNQSASACVALASNRGSRWAQAQSGQILVLVALAMVVLVGSVGLATDVGLLWSDRRKMQTATDAAAIAGATALKNGESITSAADNVAALNGFGNGAGGATITVANPPANGEYAGNPDYVEVTIAQPEPTYFLRILGYTSVNVSTLAVSGSINGPACIYALDPSAADAISVTGNIDINASCGIIDDSSSSSALSGTGNGTVTATSIGVAGNYSASGNIKFTPTPTTKIAPAPDPLANVAAPSVPTAAQLGTTSSGSYTVSGNNQTVTVPHAIYTGGISVTGNSAVVTFSGGNYGNGISIGGNTAQATFNPGQYQSGGSGNSITIAGNATTTFNPGSYTFLGTVKITGNNSVTLQPGSYFGGLAITGNATVKFSEGTYVLAGGGLSVTGNSTLSGSGVTFYNTSAPGYSYGPIDLTGNETANFSAPTSGPLEGILFFQDRSVSAGSAGSTVTGNSSSTFDGVVYFPTTALKYTGNSAGSGYTFLIADTITITGNASMTLGNNYSALSNGSPIKSSALYE